jgi:hypothetical protein
MSGIRDVRTGERRSSGSPTPWATLPWISCPGPPLMYELNTASPPLYDAATLAEVDVRVRHYLDERHPELTEDAITAAANRFTYDWR